MTLFPSFPILTLWIFIFLEVLEWPVPKMKDRIKVVIVGNCILLLILKGKLLTFFHLLLSRIFTIILMSSYLLKAPFRSFYF